MLKGFWPPPYLSLRWKALIALSLLLIAVNVGLAALAYVQSTGQFELQQSRLRDQQARQLRAMLKEREQGMTKLATLVPLLGPADATSLNDRLTQALDTNGAVLGLEWDVTSVHWVTREGQVAIAWPGQASTLPDALLSTLRESPEKTASALACGQSCGQFIAIPLLWQGRFAGSLTLERSLADALLAFHTLTGADIGIDVVTANDGQSLLDPAQPDYLALPILTYPPRSLPILRAAGPSLMEMQRTREPVLVGLEDGWFEIFRIPGLADGVDAYVINDVTQQRLGIQAATRRSLLIGIAGIVLSELLLLLIMQAPLRRLKRLAGALPLLAEKRYQDLRADLAQFGIARSPHDEIDLMVKTVGSLTDRMEHLQQDREQAEERFLWLADHDPLTRLMNRRRFNEDFALIVERAIRYQHPGTLLYLDLDAFKDVNDLSGHQVGDGLLQRVADAINEVTRSSDLVARLGGDEFAIVLPEASLDDARQLAERAQQVIRAITIREQGRQHQISASIGIVTFPSQGKEVAELLASADLAMYRAKELGRDRWQVFSDDDKVRERLDARILWKEEIAEALREDRFTMHFQPIIDIRSRAICHAESLLRLRDRHGEMTPPDRFIPIAEQTGQIQAIDHWVLRRALTTLSEHKDLKLAINLSANAMDDPAILETLSRLLAKQAVEPSRISFEITESVAINSLTSATRLMLNIKELGCRFALDDFGSGYASYAYLRQLPVDDIKIDGAFIRELPNNREDRIFVKAVTDMAHGMGKRVIAEFVDKTQVLDILEDIGVDCAQGYLFSRPLPLEQLETWVRSNQGLRVGERA
ncbi:EAL domain-containing protein [Thiorhodococcus minor]|uniref:EAL domain-containing protein n=1 Tax=Thiorhodococcus minor TaxID=57489 RepID=A0A6M0JZ84_9GAMM|nr:EAL domain-containing protein [Thiorhodococcus minor]NEV61963.1 EAL domain-containing protein [Thiorhodococcus minor]